MKKVLLVMLSIVIVVLGMLLNFKEFHMGTAVNSKNVVVTVCYAASWIYLIYAAGRQRSNVVLFSFLVIWWLTLFSSITSVYANATEAAVYWALPFIILFIGQWYGLLLLSDQFLHVSLIIAIISLGFTITILQLLKSIKHIQH
ncbi:hypothetical protein ACFP56_10380 [Paenibacillus septentrionalis]|uniref:Uncharacterized protein n=1 Tax=Paenibacillus septentrionalis TaxID=429342 RepID=A0ABW1V386_9BACL